MAASQPKSSPLIRSFAIPVDAAAFAGIPGVTSLKRLPEAEVLLAAAMDRRVVCCDLSAEVLSPKTGAAPDKPSPAVAATHLTWSHEGWVHDLDVHPDGERVATGGTDRTIKIWKWGRNEPLAAFRAHDDCVRTVAFSPDGRLLASAGDDRLVRLWDVATAESVATLDAQSSFLDALAWSVDGKELFAGGHDGKVFVWDVGLKALVRAIDVDNRRDIEDEPLNGGFSYPGGVRGLTVSPDGKLLAAVGLKSLNVFETAGGKEVLKLEGRGFGVAFDPQSRWLAFSQETNILLWDFQAGEISHRIAVNQLGLFDICFLKGSRQLASGGCNGLVGIWDLTV